MLGVEMQECFFQLVLGLCMHSICRNFWFYPVVTDATMGIQQPTTTA